MKLQTHWFSVRCLDCKTCVAACPNKCLTMTGDGLVIDRKLCESCGTCADACPSGALEMLGRDVTVEETIAELLKDRAYYEKSGGGVTLSGGEPTFQPDFAEALLQNLKLQGIHSALDTCGLTSFQTLDRILPFTDLVLFDLKLGDPVLHLEYTGVTNRQILENLAYLRDFRRAQTRQFEIWIRTPLIPGVTVSDKNIRSLGRYLADSMNGSVSRWELCAFNNLCRDQYKRLGMDWAYNQTPLMTASDLMHCAQIARSSGFNPNLVFATGATRVV